MNSTEQIQAMMEHREKVNGHKPELIAMAEESFSKEDNLGKKTPPSQMSNLLQYAQGDAIVDEIEMYIRYQAARATISTPLADDMRRNLLKIQKEEGSLAKELVTLYIAYLTRLIKIREKEARR